MKKSAGYEAGLAMRKQVLGPDYVEQTLKNADPLLMPFQDLLTIGHVQQGRLNAIAVGSSTRMASLPNVPTIAESGVPGYGKSANIQAD